MVEKRKEFLWDDGRRAERVVVDDDECEGVRVTEIYVEPKIEKKLAQRIVERRKPVVYEREIEVIDEASGEVVDKVVEATEPRAQMHVIERYVPQTIATQSVVEKDDCDCNVSREEFREDIQAAVMALAKAMNGNVQVADTSAEPVVSVQSVVEERVTEKKNKVAPLNVLLLALISAQVAAIAWILFVQ